MWLLLAMSTAAKSSQTETVEPNTDAVSDSEASREHFYYGKKGLTYDPEGPTDFWIGVRLQTRFDDYLGQNPSAADLRLERDSELDLNRGGPLGAEWMDVYFEYDQPRDDLLDLEAGWAAFSAARVVEVGFQSRADRFLGQAADD